MSLDSTKATFSVDLPYELRRHRGLPQYVGCKEIPCLACQAADEIERLRSENNLHRAIRDHSVYCRCEQCQQIRDILGEPYRR